MQAKQSDSNSMEASRTETASSCNERCSLGRHQALSVDVRMTLASPSYVGGASSCGSSGNAAALVRHCARPLTFAPRRLRTRAYSWIGPPSPLVTSYVDGDGIVDIKSLKACENVQGMNTEVIAIEGEEHVQILHSEELARQVLAFLVGDHDRQTH